MRDLKVSWAVLSREAFILLIYMAVSASTLNIFMQTRSFREGIQLFEFSKMLDGSAYRPYVYRRLVPIIANYTAKLVSVEKQPTFYKRYLDIYYLKELYFGKAKEGVLLAEEWTPSYGIKYHIVYLTLFFSLLGTSYCLRKLTDTVYHEDCPLKQFIPVLFILLIPLSFMHGGFFYDFVELFFLSVLILTSVLGNYCWWLVLLPLAVLNKESNILVPLLYAPIIISNSSTWRTRIFIAISFVVSITIYIITKQTYSQNPGETMTWQLNANIEFWLNPKNYFLWHDFFAPLIPSPRGFNIILLIVFAKLLFSDWRDKPLFAKRLFIVAMLINIPLLLLFCWHDEMRNLSFLFLPVYLLSVHTLITPDRQLEIQ